MKKYLYKLTHLFSYTTENKEDEAVKKRKASAATNIFAIISLLLLIYLLRGIK